ncbi:MULTISPECIES: TIGR03943 family protein [unclassified Clostridium]|uniref:TIGR03943 family putative permease subunit n=1 Tax=unclassified Clostridium TaxID=2614128 RepID=UPI0002977A80|nr:MULTISPECIES: TIGR03943 family protein [unclassified Clostridium]EKQ57225.1 MAG: TIGR03943 family protein [Clostridium sp. Maddingley MBC34-26]
MKKLNSDIIIKILILLCFVVFYFRIIRNNEIIMYVHPRIIPFAIFGMVAMFMVAIFLITDSYHIKKKKMRYKNYVIFIIPLIMIFFMQSASANSSIKTDDINTNSNALSNIYLTYDNSKVDSSDQKTESDGQDEDDNLYRKNNVIEVDANNFLHSINKLIEKADKYEGKEIEITGFVYKDKKLKDNEFIIGRFVMACCAADLQVVGIKCDSNNLETYDKDTWIKIKGKLKTETVNYAVKSVIVVEHIEKDPNPNTQYLYPF